jgi:hypothetical protein
MTKKSTIKLSGLAVTVAVLIITLALFAQPVVFIQPVKVQSTFAVLLTDPPVAPAGTTQLNLTYTNLAIHVISEDETSQWMPIDAAGTVNLFSLINVTKTIASTKVPMNSTVDKVQFTISDVKAVINNQTFNVTALSDTFVVNVVNTKINQTLSGVLVDFNPTLVQIQANDINDSMVNYYVLVPSANAVIINGVSEDHARVGTIVQLGENNHVRLVKVQEEFNRNITIVSASVAVNGNTTSLSVTLSNDGNVAFKVFGLTLNGEFNAARYSIKGEGFKDRMAGSVIQRIHPDTIPFKITGSSLTPLFGTNDKHDDDEGYFDKGASSIILQPGETITLSFTGIIALHTEDWHLRNPAMIITPNVDANYTIRLMGEGYQTYTVTATTLL